MKTITKQDLETQLKDWEDVLPAAKGDEQTHFVHGKIRALKKQIAEWKEPEEKTKPKPKPKKTPFVDKMDYLDESDEYIEARKEGAKKIYQAIKKHKDKFGE